MRVLTFNDLRTKGIDFSRVHLNRMIRNGAFPEPVKIGVEHGSVRNARIAWVEFGD